MYDYLIVGAGLYGAVFAREMTDAGKKCLVIDRRDHIGGNVYTKEIEGINVHIYGAHIFHTDNKEVWDYVNRFAPFNRYTNSPVAFYGDEVYNLPFNMNTFSKMWGIKTPAEAKEYIESYLANYRGVKTYMKQVVEDARESGYTQTLYGRRRYIPELKSSNFNIRSGAERIALNTPIQGTAADLIKLAMIRVDKALAEKFPEAKLLLQVHDELIVECPAQIAEAVAQLVSREMEQVATLSVPLLAEAKWGESWFDAK